MSDRRLTDAVLLAFGHRRVAQLLGLIDRSLAIKLVKSFHPQVAASVLTLVEHEKASQLIASLSRKKAQEILSMSSISEWPSEYRDQLAARADGRPHPRNERRQLA
jgi:Mg/Co/Ni transporter MgtE